MTITWTNATVELIIPVWPHSPPSPLNLTQLSSKRASADQPTVLLDRALTVQVLAHLGKATIEQGGLLLGRLWRAKSEVEAQPPNPSLPVAADLIELCTAIPALAAQGSALSLSMDAAVWETARRTCSDDASGIDSPLRVVGWYHSHPNLSAFFSHTDRQTQAAFFSNAFSVGWVIDPFTSSDSATLDEAFYLGPESLPIEVTRR